MPFTHSPSHGCFATLDGLVRYNGAQFTIFNKANTKGMTSQ